MEIRTPQNSDRLSVVGMTGSGKSQAGLYWLSRKTFAEFPWLVFDTKREDLIREILKFPGTKRMGLNDPIPKTGLHVIQSAPHELQSDAGEALLWRIHRRTHVGVFIDEGYMFDRYSAALTALYTQGRSLRIPMITLSQKPKFLNSFSLSEATFFQIFYLNDKKDRQRVGEFVPIGQVERVLPRFHSVWYDVAERSIVEFSPVPAADRILENFEAQLRYAKRVI